LEIAISSPIKAILSPLLTLKDRLSTNFSPSIVKEKGDVEKLEGLSFGAIFLSLIGKKEDRLDQEREEALAAELRYEESLVTIKELEEELKEIKNQLRNFSDVRDRYKKLIEEKERLLLQDSSLQGKRLRESLDSINELKLDIKEVEEAIYSGERVVSALEEMRDHLKSARDWGVWDVIGGGFISNMAKHSAIDNANEVSHKVQVLLKSFQKELSDVNEFTDIKVNLSGFATFADFFFDGFFVDWFVQSKINNSLDSVNGAISRINHVLRDLINNQNALKDQLSERKAEVKRILES
jgi:hypothetical protein